MSDFCPVECVKRGLAPFVLSVTPSLSNKLAADNLEESLPQRARCVASDQLVRTAVRKWSWVDSAFLAKDRDLERTTAAEAPPAQSKQSAQKGKVEGGLLQTCTEGLFW